MSGPSEKTYALHARIDTQVSGGWSIPYEAVKSSDEGRGSTTLADDGDLQFPVMAGTYALDMAFIYTGGSGASEGDFKFGFSYPTGSIYLAGLYRGTDQNLHGGIYDGSASVTVGTNGLSTNYSIAWLGILTISGSGSLVLRWAAGTASGTNTKLLTNSRLTAARRI